MPVVTITRAKEYNFELLWCDFEDILDTAVIATSYWAKDSSIEFIGDSDDEFCFKVTDDEDIQCVITKDDLEEALIKVASADSSEVGYRVINDILDCADDDALATIDVRTVDVVIQFACFNKVAYA